MSFSSARHPLYSKFLPMWDKCIDANEGSDNIKSKGSLYLPRLNSQPSDGSDEYKAYKARAVFYNATARTISAFVGQVFRKQPSIVGVDSEYLNSVTAEGMSLEDFSKWAFREMLITGRFGIMVDYSNDVADYSRLEAEEIGARANISGYTAKSIINWRERTNGGSKDLDLVVLEEIVSDPQNDFDTTTTKTQYRVLDLDIDGLYRQRVFDSEFEQVSEVYPMIDGAKLRFIPFYFLAPSGLGVTPEKSPIKDLVDVNIAHYCNSADYENSIHWCGVKTFVVKGWDESRGNGIPVGGAIPLPVDGDAYIIESSSDNSISSAMKEKENQMATLGASIIGGIESQDATATGALVRASAESGTLAEMSRSLSIVVSMALNVWAEWNGIANDIVSVRFNSDFNPKQVDAQTLTAMLNAVQMGQMSGQEFFFNLQRGEMIEDGKNYEMHLDEIQSGGTAI